MSTDKSFKTRVLWFLRRAVAVVLNSKAEVIMLFFAIAYYMPSAFIQNLIIQKLCLQRNYARDYCLSNAVNETLEESMQGEVSQLLLYFYLLKQLPAVILALFMGQWCDKYGRKYIMIISNVGCAISAILYFVNAIFIDWPPIYVVLSAIPAGLSGEYAGFMLGLYGFIRDTHPLKAVSVRVSTADGSESFAQQIGPLIGGQLYIHFGSKAVFLMCAAMLVVGIVFSAIFVKDEKFKTEVDRCVVVRDFFDCRGFASCVVTTFKKRDGHFRAYLLCVMASGFITTMSNNGFNEILFLYTRLTIHWDVTTLNYYNGLIGACGLVGSVILLPLLVNLFHWSDTTLGLLGLVANVAYYYIVGVARTPAVYYGALFLQVFSILGYVTFRSIITKCISFTEMGKVMAVYAVVQAGSTNAGQILATQIYSNTYTFLPGAYMLFVGSIGLVCIALYIWIFVDLKRNHIILEEAFKEKNEENKIEENKMEESDKEKAKEIKEKEEDSKDNERTKL